VVCACESVWYVQRIVGPEGEGRKEEGKGMPA